MTEIRKAYIDTGGGQIHARIKDGAGVPVICLHQTASSSKMFEAFMGAYGGPEPIVALDTPGFGGSYDVEGMPDIAAYGDMLWAAIDALGYRRVHLFGHHTGACIGIEMAAARPQMTASLAMIGPVVITAEEADAFRSVYPKPFEPKADGSHLAKMWAYIGEIGPTIPLDVRHRELVDTARAWSGHIKVYTRIWDQDFAGLFAKVDMPLLIMCGKGDVLWPVFERAKETRPDAKVAELGGSNFQTDEVPGEVAAAMTEFLAAL